MSSSLRPNDHVAPIVTVGNRTSAILFRDGAPPEEITLIQPPSGSDAPRLEACHDSGVEGTVWHVPADRGKPAMCNSVAFRQGWEATFGKKGGTA